MLGYNMRIVSKDYYTDTEIVESRNWLKSHPKYKIRKNLGNLKSDRISVKSVNQVLENVH